MSRFHSYPGKVDVANAVVDRTPTDAQVSASNYRHGKVRIHGLDIAVEVPVGGTRAGTSKDGRRWERRMKASYGRINRTTGKDGEPVDVFIGPDADVQLAFVISQLDESGDLDEHKVVIGAAHVDAARDIYLAHYPKWWAESRLGEIRGFFMPDFKRWLESEAPLKSTKRASELFPWL